MKAEDLYNNAHLCGKNVIVSLKNGDDVAGMMSEITADGVWVDVEKLSGPEEIFINFEEALSISENQDDIEAQDFPMIIDYTKEFKINGYTANLFETALLYEDYDVVAVMLQDRESFGEDYSDEEKERIATFLEDDTKTYMKGEGAFNRASRVFSFQKNKHGLAEMLYESVIKSGKDEEQILKSRRELSMIYLESKEYDKYVHLMNENPFLIPIHSENFLSFFQACNECGEDGDAFIDAHLKNLESMDLSSIEFFLKNFFQSQLTEYCERLPLVLFDRYVCLSGIDNAINLFKDAVDLDEITDDSELLNKFLKNKYFGVFCAYCILQDCDYKNETLDEVIHAFQESSEEMWIEFKEENDQSKMFWLLVMGKCVGLHSSKFLEDVQADWRRNISKDDILYSLEKYNHSHLVGLLRHPEYMRIIGYSDSDIDKYQRYLTNGKYPTGKSNYETASRLYIWGFLNEAVKYYVTVANEPQNIKQKEAINSILHIAVSTKNYDLFSQYYEKLDAQQKNLDIYLRFNYEIQLQNGNYEALYKAWERTGKDTEDKRSVVFMQGALMYFSNDKEPEERQKIIGELLARQGTFDYRFWKMYLQNIYLNDNALFRQILNYLLTFFTAKCLNSLEKIYEIICIDEALKIMPLGNEDMVQIMNRMSLMIPYVLITQNKYEENLMTDFLKAAQEFFEIKINAMEFEEVIGPCSYLSSQFPEEEQFKTMANIARRGNDMKAMLPKGNDSYSNGKRILLLEEDSERAEECFIEGIQTSNDIEQITKCGAELLNSLLSRNQYDEVLNWGQYILLDKGICDYAPLNLSVKTAFLHCEDAGRKQLFIDLLEQAVDQNLKDSNFQQFIDLIQFLDSLDPMNSVVSQYSELRDKAKANALNVLDDTCEGKANFALYVEQDKKKYLDLILEGLQTHKIEEEEQTSVSVSYIDTCLENSYFNQLDSFFDVIVTCQVPLNEHLLEVLYNAVMQRKNTSESISYFSALLSFANQEKKNAVLLRLEKLYGKAMDEHSEFDHELALQQMFNYVQRADSLQAKICYIRLKAVSGEIEEARELYLLLCSTIEDTPELYDMNLYLKENVFSGMNLSLEDNFNQIIKDLTLLQFNEHCGKCVPFVIFSSEEEKYKRQIVTPQAIVDFNDPTFRAALIKSIYQTPVAKYKLWFFYFKCYEKSKDEMLLFCLNNCMYITNSRDTTNQKKALNRYSKRDEEINKKYLSYLPYNKLYRKYIQRQYQRNLEVNRQISRISTDKNFFKNYGPRNRNKLAKDYIQLLKTMDDRDDYIYIKSAMFIATNNGCEEYFYELFKTDLLSREQNVCIKMCIEMLHKRMGKSKNKSKLELINRILDDFDSIFTQQQPILNLIRKAVDDKNYSAVFVRLTNVYPDPPTDESIQAVMSSCSRVDAITVLKDLVSCYENAASIKNSLLSWYREQNNRSYYEDMYQLVIETMQEYPNISTEILFDLCRLALILATVLKKKNRYSDIVKDYVDRNIGDENTEKLYYFCEICEGITEDDYDILTAIIGNNWTQLFENRGLTFYKKFNGVKELIDLSKVSFVHDLYAFLSISIEEEKNSTNIENVLDPLKLKEELLPDINGALEAILDKSLREETLDFCDLPSETRNMFIEYITYMDQTVTIMPDLANWVQTHSEVGISLIQHLVKIWTAITPEDIYIANIRNMDWDDVVYDLIMLDSINELHSPELLESYTKDLYFKEEYEKILEINERVDWACRNLQFTAYYYVSMYLTNNPDEVSYLNQLNSESLINVLILLKQSIEDSKWEEMYDKIPARAPFINCAIQILKAGKEEDLNTVNYEVEQLSEFDDKIALHKLLYKCTRQEFLRNQLIEQYGETVSQNNYFAVKRDKTIAVTEAEPRSEKVQDESTGQLSQNGILKEDDPIQLVDGKTVIKDIPFVLRAQAEVGLSEYKDGIPKGETKKLNEEYKTLGQIRDNLMLRKEKLSKLSYIAKKNNNPELYVNFAIELGVVLFYIDDNEGASYNGRHILYETAKLLHISKKHTIFELFRDAVNVLLLSFKSFEEIIQEKQELLELLDAVLKENLYRNNSYLYRTLKTIIQELSESTPLSPDGHRAYSNAINKMNNRIVKPGQNAQATKIYRKWQELLKNEVKKMDQDAMLSLDVETVQCSNRGKICGIINNIGGADAQDINIKIVFEQGIRCKDNELNIGNLSKRDTITFSFPIICQETSHDDIDYRYSITLSYRGKDNVTRSYDDKIRITADSQFEHIQNLYSLSPVTTNSEFYGREKEKETIFNIINNDQFNTSIVMHGLKRVGKTSMLHYIERAFVDSNKYIPVYKSAQSVGNVNGIGQMFVQSVVEALENRGLADDECRSYLSYNCSENPEKLYEFYMYLQKSDTFKGKCILFMADEIEEIFDGVNKGEIKQEFYKVLRVILQEITSVRFIFCGADQLTEILHNHALADIFEVTTRVNISRLDEESIRKMIVEPATDCVSFTNNFLDRVWYYTHGHTFYSKQICSYVINHILNEEQRSTAYAYDVDVAVKQNLRKAEYFGYLSRFFNENESLVVQIMCNNIKRANTSVPFSLLEEQFKEIAGENYERSMLIDALDSLVFRDIIISEETYNEEKYKFSIEMFRLWYKKANSTGID